MITTKSSFKNRIWALYIPALKSRTSFLITTFIMMCLTIGVPYFVWGRSGTYWILAGEGDKVQERLINYFSAGVITSVGWQVATLLLLGAMAFAAALNASSYLHSKSRTDLYHALPATRPQLLLSNLAASMTAIVAPYLLVHFFVMAAQHITYGAYGCFGAEYYRNTFLHLFTNLLFLFAIYAYTTFISVQVGTGFDALAVSAVIGFIPMFIYGICGMIWQSQTYGAIFNGRLVLLLSPFTFVFERYMLYAYTAGFWVGLAVWVLASLLFLGAAILLYRRRKSERAGQTQSQGYLQTIVKVFVAFCGAILFLGITYNAAQFTQSVSMILGGVAIGIIAEIILSRGVKQVVRNLKWLAAGSVLACLFQAGVSLDIIGYQTRLPQADRVAGVTVTYSGRYASIATGTSNHLGIEYSGGESARQAQWKRGFTGSESVEEVLAAHSVVVQNRPENVNYYSSPGFTNEYVEITYYLVGGGTMTRNYHSLYYEAFELLAELEDNEDFIRYNNPLFWIKDAGKPNNDHLVSWIRLDDPYGIGSSILYSAAPGELLDALRSDLLAESAQQIKYPDAPAVGYIQISYEGQANIKLPLPAHYGNTLAVLEEQGVLQELQASHRAPDKLYIIPAERCSYNNYYTHRVNVALPLEANSSELAYYQENKYKDVPVEEVSNPQRIQSVLAAGRAQLFQWRDAMLETVVIVAEKDGVIRGRQLAYTADLPPFLRGTIQEYQTGQGAADTDYDTYHPEPELVAIEKTVSASGI